MAKPRWKWPDGTSKMEVSILPRAPGKEGDLYYTVQRVGLSRAELVELGRWLLKTFGEER